MPSRRKQDEREVITAKHGGATSRRLHPSDPLRSPRLPSERRHKRSLLGGGHFKNGKWTKAWKVRTKSIRVSWGCDGKRQGKSICLCLPARGAPLFCPDDKKSEIKGELLEKKHFPEREEWLRAGLSFSGRRGGQMTKRLRIHLPMQETQEIWVRSLGQKDPLWRKWQPTPVLLPGESHGQRSLAGYSPRDSKELDITKQLSIDQLQFMVNYYINFFLNSFHLRDQKK